ncbi:DUF3768 domain-containing protein [Sphingobium chungangianum]|jgi:hypothetical protein
MTHENAADQAVKTATIAALNDAMRHNIYRMQGFNQIVVTAGISAMIGEVAQWTAYRRQCELLRLVREYNDFSEDNDPHDERDFGAFDWEGTRCYWKIDYYDPKLEWGSSDPSDPAQTARVLTILRADEY